MAFGILQRVLLCRFVQLCDDVLLVLSMVTAEYWQGTPEAHRDGVESVVACILGIVGYGPDLLGFNPLASGDFQTIDILIHLDHLALHLDPDGEIKSLNLQRIF